MTYRELQAQYLSVRPREVDWSKQIAKLESTDYYEQSTGRLDFAQTNNGVGLGESHDRYVDDLEHVAMLFEALDGCQHIVFEYFPPIRPIPEGLYPSFASLAYDKAREQAIPFSIVEPTEESVYLASSSVKTRYQKALIVAFVNACSANGLESPDRALAILQAQNPSLRKKEVDEIRAVFGRFHQLKMSRADIQVYSDLCDIYKPVQILSSMVFNLVREKRMQDTVGSLIEQKIKPIAVIVGKDHLDEMERTLKSPHHRCHLPPIMLELLDNHFEEFVAASGTRSWVRRLWT